jgi:hypothetical protein
MIYLQIHPEVYQQPTKTEEEQIEQANEAKQQTISREEEENEEAL